MLQQTFERVERMKDEVVLTSVLIVAAFGQTIVSFARWPAWVDSFVFALGMFVFALFIYLGRLKGGRLYSSLVWLLLAVIEAIVIPWWAHNAFLPWVTVDSARQVVQATILGGLAIAIALAGRTGHPLKEAIVKSLIAIPLLTVIFLAVR
jgi:hypothetical protein